MHVKRGVVLLVSIFFLALLSSGAYAATCEWTDEYIELGDTSDYGMALQDAYLEVPEGTDVVIRGIGWDTDNGQEELGFVYTTLSESCELGEDQYIRSRIRRVDGGFLSPSYDSRTIDEPDSLSDFLAEFEAYIGPSDPVSTLGDLDNDGNEFHCAGQSTQIPENAVVVGWGGAVCGNNHPGAMSLDVWNFTDITQAGFTAQTEDGSDNSCACSSIEVSSPQLFIGTGTTGQQTTYGSENVPVGYVLVGLGTRVNDGDDELTFLKTKFRKIIFDGDEDGVIDNPDEENYDVCPNTPAGEDVIETGEFAGCSCAQLAETGEFDGSCNAGLQGSFDEQLCYRDQDLGKILSDGTNDYICLNNLDRGSSPGAYTTLHNEDLWDSCEGNDWCWVSAINQFKIATIHTAALTYDVVANGQKWLACQDPSTQPDMLQGVDTVSDRISANRFTCYDHFGAGAWATCFEPFEGGDIPEGFSEIDNGLRNRFEGDGALALSVDDLPEGGTSILDIDLSSLHQGHVLEVGQLTQESSLNLLLRFTNEDLFLPAAITLSLKDSEGVVLTKLSVLEHATNNPVLQDQGWIHLSIPLPSLLGVSSLEFASSRDANTFEVRSVRLLTNGQDPLCSGQSSPSQSNWLDDGFDHFEAGNIISGQPLCDLYFDPDASGNPISGDAWFGDERLDASQQCCGDDLGEYYLGEDKGCWNSNVLLPGESVGQINYNVTYYRSTPSIVDHEGYTAVVDAIFRGVNPESGNVFSERVIDDSFEHLSFDSPSALLGEIVVGPSRVSEGMHDITIESTSLLGDESPGEVGPFTDFLPYTIVLIDDSTGVVYGQDLGYNDVEAQFETYLDFTRFEDDLTLSVYAQINSYYLAPPFDSERGQRVTYSSGFNLTTESYSSSCLEGECVYPLPSPVPLCLPTPEDLDGCEVSYDLTLEGLSGSSHEFYLALDDGSEIYIPGDSYTYYSPTSFVANLVARQVSQSYLLAHQDDVSAFYACGASPIPEGSDAERINSCTFVNGQYCAPSTYQRDASGQGYVLSSTWTSQPLSHLGYDTSSLSDDLEDLGATSLSLLNVEEELSTEEQEALAHVNTTAVALVGKNLLSNARFVLNAGEVPHWTILDASGSVVENEREKLLIEDGFRAIQLSDGEQLVSTSLDLPSFILDRYELILTQGNDFTGTCGEVFYDPFRVVFTGSCLVAEPTLELAPIGGESAANFSTYPEEDEIGNNNFRAPVACCPQNHCWNGYACVAPMNDNPRLAEKIGDEYYRCIDGDWTQQSPKTNWLGEDWGFCAQQSQCFVATFDDAIYADNTGISGADLLAGQAVECLASGDYALDHYCEEGDWSTRTKVVADRLLSAAPSDYALYCDTYSQSLIVDGGELQYFGDEVDLANPNPLGEPIRGVSCFEALSGLDDSHPLSGLVDDKDNSCINNACVLVNLNNPEQVYVGMSLNKDLNDESRSVLGAFGVDSSSITEGSVCTGTGDEFTSCEGYSGVGSLWYNQEINAIIYANEGNLPDGTGIGGFFRDLFSRDAVFEDLFEESINVRELYAYKKNSLQVGAIKGSIPTNRSISAIYTGFDTPLCSFADEERLANPNLREGALLRYLGRNAIDCIQDGTTFSLHVRPVSSLENSDQDLDWIWPQLTAHLRPEE